MERYQCARREDEELYRRGVCGEQGGKVVGGQGSGEYAAAVRGIAKRRRRVRVRRVWGSEVGGGRGNLGNDEESNWSRAVRFEG